MFAAKYYGENGIFADLFCTHLSYWADLAGTCSSKQQALVSGYLQQLLSARCSCFPYVSAQLLLVERIFNFAASEQGCSNRVSFDAE